MAGKARSARFRRLIESVARQELLTPHLEAAITARGDRAWPDEYPVKVHNKERVWDGFFHPSSDAYAPRLYLYNYFARHDELAPREEDSTGVMTLHMGSAVHAIVQSLLIHLGLTELGECEAGFTDRRRWCSGSLDVRRLFLPSGETPPLEIKSAAYLPRDPMPQHLAQCQPYMDLGAHGGPAERMVLLYVRKAYPHDFKEFVIERDEGALEAIYSKWRDVLQAVEAGVDPGFALCPGCERGNRVHLACPARNVCKIGPPPGRAK